VLLVIATVTRKLSVSLCVFVTTSANGRSALSAAGPRAVYSFVILPMGETAWYSFFNWNGYGLPLNGSAGRTTKLIFKQARFGTR
jgi:ABC-type sugar transport system permease subunit